ncbi:hypothetical protein ABZP36_020246 [Zizania latifolia]
MWSSDSEQELTFAATTMTASSSSSSSSLCSSPPQSHRRRRRHGSSRNSRMSSSAAAPAGNGCGGRSEASAARSFDVNWAPSVAAGGALGMDEDEEGPAAPALSSSPNDSGGSFPLDLSAHGLRGPADAAVQGGGERSSSRASDDERGRCAPWDPQTTVHVESIHINAARVVISLWNLAAPLHV